VAYIIAEPCIGTKDTACVDACPVDCIHPKKDTKYEDGRPGFEQVDQLFIDPVECIDCGACVPVCPVSAIFALDDLPEKWHAYIASVITSKPAIRYHFKTGQRTSLRTLRCCTVPVVIPARVFSMGGDPARPAGGSRKGDFSGAL
jgi:ferredoxin